VTGGTSDDQRSPPVKIKKTFQNQLGNQLQSQNLSSFSPFVNHSKRSHFLLEHDLHKALITKLPTNLSSKCNLYANKFVETHKMASGLFPWVFLLIQFF
jgi:hypothetical protein